MSSDNADHSSAVEFETFASHRAMVGAIEVRRALPQRSHRTIGAWCFADHMGPASVTEERGLDIGPHPHTGLATLTWLIEGEAVHRDSLGSEQLIRPGQLNLMSAGYGVAHAEEPTGAYRGTLEGIQLWIAQPEHTRHGARAFEHHGELPHLMIGTSEATVLVGEMLGEASPVRHDTALLGLDLDLRGVAELPLDPTFEYGVIVLRGAVSVGGSLVEPGTLAYFAPGADEWRLETRDPARVIVLGGEPWLEGITMWWNFVARNRDELTAAYFAWVERDERYGTVASPLAAIDAPVPFWLHSERAPL
ncbi:MAG: pirin family protein [Actinomycetales bacterium]|nr:pirin family protein [Actinomycetales bacterium]